MVEGRKRVPRPAAGMMAFIAVRVLSLARRAPATSNYRVKHSAAARRA